MSLTLRLSVTDRCQMGCVYCRPAGGCPATSASLTPSLTIDETTLFARLMHQRFGVAKIRITGGEPLLRADIVDLVRHLASVGVPDLAMTTNGQRLAPLASELRAAGLHRLNVSLDSLDSQIFRALSRTGSLDRTLEGIHAALAAGFSSIKLNAVVMRGWNDSEAPALVDFALQTGCELRFIELMPTGLGQEQYSGWFISSDELRTRLAARFTLEALPTAPSASARRFRIGDGRGRLGVVGFISPNSHPFCAGCQRLRLTAQGDLVGCLGRADRFSIAELLRAGDADRIADLARQALSRKRAGHPLYVPRLMSSVGG